MTLRCPECRSRRTTFKAMAIHIAAKQHRLCNCGGYHFEHRPGSPLCERNPFAAFHAARRDPEAQGDFVQLLADCAYDAPPNPSRAPCPF